MNADLVQWGARQDGALTRHFQPSFCTGDVTYDHFEIHIIHAPSQLQLCNHPYQSRTLITMTGQHYSDEDRARMVGMASTSSYRTVAAHFGCAISTVACNVKMSQQKGTISSPKRLGRSPFTTPQVLSRIKRLARQHKWATWQQLIVIFREAAINLSLTTIRKFVRDRLGLHRGRAISKPFLTRQARKLRFDYAKAHQKDTVSNWRRTIFVDEAMVKVNGNGVVWVTLATNKAYLEECMRAKMKGRVDGIMLFAGIWHGGGTELVSFDTSGSTGKRKGVTAAIYRDQITKGPLKTAWNRLNNRWRGYGGARILEDIVGIHKSPVNRLQGLQ